MKIVINGLLLMVVLLVPSLHAKSVGSRSAAAQKAVVQPKKQVPAASAASVSKAAASALASKNTIVTQLDTLLSQDSTDDAWHDSVDNLIADLFVLDKNMASDYLKKIRAKEAQVSAAALAQMSPQQPSSFPESEIKKNIPSSSQLMSKSSIITQLDALLREDSINDAWYSAMNDLIFDLSFLDRNMANDYLKKMHTKNAQTAAAETTKIFLQEAAAQPTPPPAPPLPSGAMRKGTPPPAPPLPSAPMRKGTPPPAPPLPPLKEKKKKNIPLEEEVPAPVAMPQEETFPSAPKKNVNAIIAQLDALLLQESIDDAWYNSVDNLIFDLSVFDKNMATSYLKKIYAKNAQVAVESIPPVTLSPVPLSPAGEMKKGVPPAPPAIGGMQQGTPPPPPGAMKKSTPSPMPSAPGGAMTQGTPPPPPGGGMTKAGPPPPPGPMPKLGAKKAASSAAPAATPAAPKGPEPLSIRGTYSAARFAKETNAELIKLFDDLLVALATVGDFWNAVTKKPQLDWENKIGAVKKALLVPTRNIKIDVNKAIENRIKQVRELKVQQGQAQIAAAEQVKAKEEHKEEISEPELIALIDALLKKPDVSDFKWLVQFTGTVKKLDAINHDKAVEYQTNFITKFPDQKPFLPKKKVIEVKKEATAEEQKVAMIDKIIHEKPAMWAIKVREHVQDLYDMNPELGLAYQDKVLAATKKPTGKEDKPFLRLKE